MEFGFQTPQKNLKFHSAAPREMSNFSVVFEPNSKFHSPQKDVFAKIWLTQHKISIRVNFFLFVEELIFHSVQSLKYEDNEQKWLETVTDWGEIGSSLNLTENLKF